MQQLFGLLIAGISATVSRSEAKECNNADGKWYFSNNPNSRQVIEGRRTFLECGANQECNLMFYWEMDDQEVINTTRRYQQGTNLIIERADRKLDSGSFRCVGVLMHSGMQAQAQHSDSARITFTWMGDDVRVVEREKYETGKSIRLKCDYSGSADTVFKWYRNGIRLRKLVYPRLRFEARQQFLEIASPKEEDVGTYSCEAINDAKARESSVNWIWRGEGSTSLKLRNISAPQLVRPGSDAKLTCDFDGADLIAWARDGKRLEQTGPVLTVPQVSRKDEGWYVCTGSDSKGTKSFGIRITLAVIDNFDTRNFLPRRESFRYVVGRGKRLEVTCVPPEAYPPATVQWMRAESPSAPHRAITPTGGRVRSQPDGTLLIQNVHEEDEGGYECVATALAGTKTAKIQVLTSVQPRITFHPLSRLVYKEGENVTLQCKFQGTPFPLTRVTWIKDGEYVLPASNLVMDERSGKLSLHRLSHRNNGSYKCQVLTEGQEPVLSSTSVIRIRERLKFDPEPKDKKLELEKAGQLECKARGEEAPTVNWLKVAHMFPNGTFAPYEKPITFSERGDRTRSVNGTLYFLKVTRADQGNYTCVAVSTQGIINQTVTMEVFRKLQFTTKSPHLKVRAGDTAYLHCQAEADPPPKIHWFRGDNLDWEKETKTPNSRFVTLPNNTLVISNLTREDTGRWVCGAGHKHGFIKHDVIVCIVEPEGALYCGQNVYRTPEFGDASAQDEGSAGVPTQTVAIVCSVAGVYVVLVVIMSLWCRRNRKGKNGATNDGNSSVTNGYLLADQSSARPLSTPPHANGSVSSRPVSTERTHIRRDSIQWLGKLGSGIYGDVFTCRVHQNEGAERLVFAKSLTSRDEQMHIDLHEEIEMFSRLRHPNVAALIGISDEASPFMVCYEYLEYGNLKSYMTASRSYLIANGSPPPLTLEQIISIAYQVCAGMQYMSKHRFTHRDLAARNVLVSSSLQAKITNMSLSKDAFASEYYTYRHLTLPVRWMPPEAVFDDDFSTKSDTWSFAVFLWELLTAGCLPYPLLSDEAVIETLKRGELSLDFQTLGVGPTPLPAIGDGIGGPPSTVESSAASLPPPFSSPSPPSPAPPTEVALSTVTSASGASSITSYDRQFLERLAACMLTDPRDRPTFDSLHEFMTNALQQRGTVC